MRNLRVQLLLSQVVLVALMMVVMAGASITFLRLGRSIDRILKDNYASVIVAQKMKEALERIDSSAAFVLAGQVQRARAQYAVNRRAFEKAYWVEAHNITEKGEQQLSDAIGKEFDRYHRQVEQLLNANPPMPTAQARAHYFSTLEPAFRGLKQQAQAILDMNQEAIVRADAHAKAAARAAAWQSITVTFGTLLIATLFGFFTLSRALAPLRILARQAEEIGAGHLNQKIELRRSDEIGALAEAFNHMAGSLREARRNEELRLHRAERMSDAALDSLYDPVVVTDAAGRTLHLNRAAEGLFGSASRAVGTPVARVVQEERITHAVERAIRQERVSADEGEAALVPMEIGGTQRTYRLRAAPMRDEDGALLGAAIVLEDVTHLRELDRLKTEFISVASHELRTPVTSLLLSVHLLQEGAAGPLTPDDARPPGHDAPGNRSRAAALRDRAAARPGAGRHGRRGPTGRGEGGRRGYGRAGRAARRPCGPGADHPGAAEPAEQCRAPHPGWGQRWGLGGRARGKGPLRGRRYRHGDPAGVLAAHLRAVRASARGDARWRRPGPLHRPDDHPRARGRDHG